MSGEDQVGGLLGELEQAIMAVVWERDAVSVRAVHNALRPERSLAYTTVMTVMSRLADKDILIRQKRGRAYVYRAAQPGRRGFMRRQARLQVQGLLRRFGDLAVAEFVDELSEADAERLAALEALLAEHHGNRPGDER